MIALAVLLTLLASLVHRGWKTAVAILIFEIASRKAWIQDLQLTQAIRQSIWRTAATNPAHHLETRP